MDIITGLQTTQGKQKYYHLLRDSYSKRCEAFTLPNQEASEIARVLYKEIIIRYGALRTPQIHCSGWNCVSNLVNALPEIFQITRYLTSSYHPQPMDLLKG